jgi:hypothetical protein
MADNAISSASALRATLKAIHRQVSVAETTESWLQIEQGIVQLTECCGNGGCNFPSEMLAGIRSLSRPLNVAMNSERSRVSGSAIELVSALSAGLGVSFESLISLFVPTLLGLCAQTNKIFTRRRARACIFTVVDNTPSPSLLPYLAESVRNKSASLRLVAAEGFLSCLNSINSRNNTCARLTESVIKSTARDTSVDVRTTGKNILEAYKVRFPARAARFVISVSRHDVMSHIPFSFIVPSTPASRTRGMPSQTSHKEASRQSQQPAGQRKLVWGGGPATRCPKPVVRVPSKGAKLCGRENSYTHKLAAKDIPLPPGSTTVPLANRPLRTGRRTRRASWRPRRRGALPTVTMEVISENAEIG